MEKRVQDPGRKIDIWSGGETDGGDGVVVGAGRGRTLWVQ